MMGKQVNYWRMMVFAFSFLAGGVLADDRGEFDRAYAAYDQHVNAGEPELAKAAAKDALKFGTRVFGKENVNTVNLAVNYARLLNDAGDYKAAHKALDGTLKVLEAKYGDGSSALVPLVIQLARAASEPAESFALLQRAASLSRGYEDNLIEAQKNVDIMVILLSRGGGALVGSFVERAYEIYSERLQPNDARLGLMAYHKARLAMARNQPEVNLTYLQQALTAFLTPDGEPMGDFERSVRMQMVAAYEALKQPVRATEQLLLLGASQTWSASPEPVYRPEAELPPGATGRGAVTVAFGIDEQGFVVQPTISKSTAPSFDAAALKMLGQARFVPRFVDGKPVATTDLLYTANFDVQPPDLRPRKFERPTVKEMMNPDRNDISRCFGAERETIAGCESVGPGKGGGGGK
jgi:TonB family protein